MINIYDNDNDNVVMISNSKVNDNALVVSDSNSFNVNVDDDPETIILPSTSYQREEYYVSKNIMDTAYRSLHENICTKYS